MVAPLNNHKKSTIDTKIKHRTKFIKTTLTAQYVVSLLLQKYEKNKVEQILTNLRRH